MCVIVIVISHLLWANANGEARTQMAEIHLTLEQTQQGGCDKKETGQKSKWLWVLMGKKAALVMVADIERLQLPTAILCLFFRPIGQYHDTLPTINFQSVNTNYPSSSNKLSKGKIYLFLRFHLKSVLNSNHRQLNVISQSMENGISKSY